MAISEQMHSLNIRYPWLKVVALLLLLIGTAVGVEELLRNNISRPDNSQSTAVALLSKMPEPVAIIASDPSTEKLPEIITTTESEEQDESEASQEPEAQPVAQPEAPAVVEPEVSTPQVTTPATRKLVALTFDDGPSQTETTRLLQILAAKGVKATFFVLGNNAQKAPDILQQAKAAGHEIGSHTMTHANLSNSTVEGIRWEMAAMDGVFINILGEKPQIMRPPYGNINANVRANVNIPMILWTVDPEDWKVRNAATVRSRAVSAAFDGAIILFHDIYATTVDAIPGVIDDLMAQGYEFMTVSELAAARGVQLQTGIGYGSFRP